MVYLALLLAVASLVFWVYVLFDVIGADSERVRLLPKPLWAMIVLFLPKLGPAAWFLLGRPAREPAASRGPVGPPPPFPEYEHPGRARASSPEEDEEFLRRCRERAEEQRRRAREIQNRQERARWERERGEHDGDEDPADPSS
ncbi:PLD nuclease N-terminal domain-containing protein [Nocardiopsis alkaliphila]|uniref:PLD nuclease N-terminal domain-containing protein n=1 Tax=Nocardiopsis alkaliphila TaxID=225762 RepID=UPI00034AD876|nr:PLD nuclease N-terminal domain-containing protein [Nocardiopsis alkaliphila]